jgi:hypothetical protein
MQIAQTRITGAEIVNRKLNAEFADLFQHRNHAFGVFHHRAFGQFQFQTSWIHLRFRKIFFICSTKSFCAKCLPDKLTLTTRFFRGDLLCHFDHLTAGSSQKSTTSSENQTRIFADRNKFVRRNKPARRVIPANQGLQNRIAASSKSTIGW